MSDVRAAVIGLAWGQLHIDALRRVKDVEVVAVCDTDGDRAKVIAKNAGVKYASSNPAEILGREEIGLITIATPPHTQRDLANKAMLAKKAVLVESPGGLNSQDAKALLETSQQRKIA